MVNTTQMPLTMEDQIESDRHPFRPGDRVRTRFDKSTLRVTFRIVGLRAQYSPSGQVAQLEPLDYCLSHWWVEQWVDMAWLERVAAVDGRRAGELSVGVGIERGRGGSNPRPLALRGSGYPSNLFRAENHQPVRQIRGFLP